MPLLLIAREAPEHWTVSLPDLKSRLAAVPHVRIEEPDDALMRSHRDRPCARRFGPCARRAGVDRAAARAKLCRRGVGADTLNRASIASSRKISIASAKEMLLNCHISPIVARIEGRPVKRPQTRRVMSEADPVITRGGGRALFQS